MPNQSNQNLGNDPFVLDHEIISGVRDVLVAVDFSTSGILRHMGVEESPPIIPQEMPRLFRLTQQCTPLDCFIRLFLMRQEMEMDAFRAAIAPMSVESWRQLGLIRADDNTVTAPLMIVPFKELLVAFDTSSLTASQEMTPNQVLGVGLATRTLLNATIRKQVDAILDIGTGCGIQGLICASHGGRIIGTDVNPRALNVAAFNAALNGINNMELREGSLFNPVKELQFDLITMNPPFAISPDHQFYYRDGGMDGDNFVKHILTEAPRCLKDGGFCQITAQWAHVRGEDWRVRLSRWFDANGCDVLVLKLKTQAAETYTTDWLWETETHSPESYRRQWESWMHYLEARDIEAISTGLITMRRRSTGKNWFLAHEDITSIDEYAGDAISLGFLLRDFLDKTDPLDLLHIPFRMAQDFRIELTSVPAENKLVTKGVVMHRSKGLHYAGNLDPHIINLIAQCDGNHPLQELIQKLAASKGIKTPIIQDSVLKIMRTLIERGFLLPPHLFSPSHAC
ncbi:MAG: class I SAM-dependent methyltransferase [Syntrophaceae bacterium]